MEIDKRELDNYITKEDDQQDETIPPQWICMSCKTVVGPIVDDDEHKCNCTDMYLVDLWLVAPVAAVEHRLAADVACTCAHKKDGSIMLFSKTCPIPSRAAKA